MSVRTFTRRFRDEVGLSPNRWLTQQRVALARRLLETTDLPVDQVAQRVGIGTAASLRLHLAASVGVSPTAYRRTFRPRDDTHEPAKAVVLQRPHCVSRGTTGSPCAGTKAVLPVFSAAVGAEESQRQQHSLYGAARPARCLAAGEASG